MFDPKPLTLFTEKVKLIPLTMAHLPEFFAAGNYPAVWQWAPPFHCETLETAKLWLQLAMTKKESGDQVPFAIIDISTNTLIGSTRYTSINRHDKGIEIGFTFITPKYQRTYVNTHAKYLLLKHAFEDLGAIRVEFKTHEQNQKSRNAIARIGGKFEGILRHQRILFDGSFRNTALFSIINSEWPEVKVALEDKMEAYNHVE